MKLGITLALLVDYQIKLFITLEPPPMKLISQTDFSPLKFAIVVAAILIASVLTTRAHSQEQINWSTSYREAANQADRQNAPIMLFFQGSDWCPWSQKLTSEVFETPEFAAWSDGKLVPVMLDFPKQTTLPIQLKNQNAKLLEKYRPHLTGFPTALFLKSDGTVIGKMGYEKGGVRSWTSKAQKIVGKLDKIAMLNLNRFFH
ncbi:MAG: thioredoxin family protein [Planctomycetota bacterium]